MRFDLSSFLIGFGSAALIALVLYRLRGMLSGMRRSAESQAGSTGRFLRNSAANRYFEEITKFANRYHLAGEKVALSEIFVEPRFIPAIEPINLDETSRIGSVFHVVPKIHDLPAIYSPYNINTLSLNDLRTGERHLLFLGLPGAGKSTALAVLTLYASSLIDLQSLDVLAEQVLEDEDKELNEQQRAERARIRKEQQERALEQLHLAQSRSGQAESEQKPKREPVDFKALMPILVHVRDIDLAPESYGGKTPAADAKAKVTLKALDPAEPLVKAITRHFSVVAASTAPRLIYNQLANGRCLVMLDGFDEIAPALWPEKLAWLDQFTAAYGANFIIVTGPAEGFDPLVNAGFTPLYVRPWSDTDFQKLVDRWAAAWPMIAGTRRSPAAAPDERLIKRAATANRGRTPLDVTLKTWAAFAGDEQEAGRRGVYDYFVRAQLDDAEKQRAPLAAVAADALDHGGLIRRERIKDVIKPLLIGENGKPVANIDEFIGKLVGKSGLLVEAPGNAYAFRHRLLAAFMASETLAKAPPERIAEVALKPEWQTALPFAATLTPIDAAISARLGAAPDLLYSTLFDLAPWLPDAPADAPWRAEVFKRLTAALLAPVQYLAVRERAAAALVTSRDKGVLFVLRQALRSTDAGVRRLGCVGLGALGDTEAIKDLAPMLTDSDPDVQLAAGLALGAIKSDAALETMMTSLLEGEEGLRRAVAETLAAIPDGGHEILRDAMRSSDMMVRRAGVFGLSRVNVPWALSLLYRALLEDDQWYVRSAAEQAFREAEKPEGTGPTAHPDADQLPWLISWAATKGEGVPNGPGARQVLIRALQEGDPLIRAAAALTLAYLGYVPGLKPLYSALRDKDENVRGTVYEALGLLQSRLGQPLPAVV